MAIKTVALTKWFPIFRAGTWTDSSGKVRSWSESDIDAIVNYNGGRAVPAVVGHPKNSDPAWGWLAGLKKVVVDGVPHVYAQLRDVVSEFADMVAAGMFPNVSVSLTMPDMALRHIGFLGAVPPGVEGMAPAQFSGADASDLVYEFALSEQRTQSVLRDLIGIMGRVRDWIVSREGIEAADQVASNGTIQWLYTDVEKLTEAAPSATASYSKPKGEEMSPELKSLQDQVAALSAQVAEFERTNAGLSAQVTALSNENIALRASVAGHEAASRLTEYSSFVDEQVRDGRLVPAMRDVVVGLMANLAPADEYEFSAGSKQSPLEAFRALVSALPKAGPVSHEVATKGAAGVAPDNTDSNDIAKRALEYQAAQRTNGVEVTISQAVYAVTAK